jgi:hypothetical protein
MYSIVPLTHQTIGLWLRDDADMGAEGDGATLSPSPESSCFESWGKRGVGHFRSSNVLSRLDNAAISFPISEHFAELVSALELALPASTDAEADLAWTTSTIVANFRICCQKLYIFR